MFLRTVLICVSFLSSSLFAQTSSTQSFEPLSQWASSLADGDMTRFEALYSTAPPVQIVTGALKQTGASKEVEFWNSIRGSGMRDFHVELFSESTPREGAGRLLSVHIDFKIDTAAGSRTRYVLYHQLWQKQGENWRITKLDHSDVLKMRQPSKMNPNLYDDRADASREIEEAVQKATLDRKRIILVFGGNWCYDCQVLEFAFHQPEVAPLIEKFYVIHVDIGTDGKKNRELAAKYDTVLDKGVPALAVLDSDGKLLMGQQNGEWESARLMDPDDIIAFLEKWKPATK